MLVALAHSLSGLGPLREDGKKVLCVRRLEANRKACDESAGQGRELKSLSCYFDETRSRRSAYAILIRRLLEKSY